MCLRRLRRSPKRVAVSVQQLRNWPPGEHAGVFATILGCLAMPWLAERLGRRGALAVFLYSHDGFHLRSRGKRPSR